MAPPKGFVPWNKGKKTGIVPRTAYRKGDKRITGKNNSRWAGDCIGYQGRHYWLYDNFGKPSFCEICGTQKARRFEWANISGRYLKDRGDWLRTCASCHRKLDGVAGVNSINTNFNRNKLEGTLPAFA